MKIVCDACQAKYSISDDKVQGKVFKIRCKKCSNIIVVRGGAGATEAPAPAPQEKDTRVYDYGYDGGGDQPPAAEDAVWHLVINQDQIGPMTVAEVEQRFAAGEVDAESFTWREGFADWLPLAQVDTFASLVASGPPAAAAVSGSGHAAVSAMFGSSDDTGSSGASRSDPGDLFASASGGGAARSHEEDDAGGDLFGSKPAAAQPQAAAANSKLRGERNENSVLFSLNNLAQLASDTPARSASPSAHPPMGHATGQAGGEGSGLIDIRSMANAYLGGSGAAVGKPASTSSIGSIDDLPVFGGGGFSEPAVIVPSARAQTNNKVLYLMIGAVGLLAVVAVVMVMVLLKGGNKAPQVAAVDDKAKTAPDKTDTTAPAPDKAATTGGTVAATGSADSAGSATAPANGSDAGSATQVAAADPKTTQSPTAHNPVPPAPAHHDPKTVPHTGGAVAPAPQHDPKPAKPDPVAATKPDKPVKADAGGGGCDEVSCVLNNYDGACCSKFKKKSSGGGGGGGGDAKPHSDLPDALDRSMISAGIASVKARVSSCGDKSPTKGQVKVHVKVGGDGRVSEASVLAAPDNALGACVAAAVQKASFAKTQGGGSFSYPFMF